MQTVRLVFFHHLVSQAYGEDRHKKMDTQSLDLTHSSLNPDFVRPFFLFALDSSTTPVSSERGAACSLSFIRITHVSFGLVLQHLTIQRFGVLKFCWPAGWTQLVESQTTMQEAVEFDQARQTLRVLTEQLRIKCCLCNNILKINGSVFKSFWPSLFRSQFEHT